MAKLWWEELADIRKTADEALRLAKLLQAQADAELAMWRMLARWVEQRRSDPKAKATTRATRE